MTLADLIQMSETNVKQQLGKSAKDLVNEIAMRTLPMAGDIIDKRRLSDITSDLERLNRGIFRLVVMGEIKKGKSSFINALLSEPDLLPTSSDVATSTVFKLIYGPVKRYKVFFLPDPESGAVFPPKVIRRDELAFYGTEDGNPHNEKRVDFIGIELPNPMLETGLVIVDTPGVGGLFKAHRDITWRFAPNADGIIFVLDSVESVISADEIEFLQDLTTKYTNRLFFVQTKIDNASQDLWQGWESRNKQVLEEQVTLEQANLFYFPLSAKLKNAADKTSNLKILERSGYLPLVNFVNRKLIPAKDDQIALGVARKLKAIASNVASELRSQMELCKESAANDLASIESDRRAAVEQFSNWEQQVLNPKLKEATTTLNRIRRDSVDRVDELLNPNGRLLLEFVDRQSDKSGHEIQGQAGLIQQDFMELCGTQLGHVFDGFVKEYGRVCSEVVETLRLSSDSFEITKSETPEVDVDYRRVSRLAMSASTPFEIARNVLFGGFGGMAIASSALSVASMAFPPLAAYSIVVWAGGLYGATEVKRLGDLRRKDEALAKLRGLLSEQLSQIRRSVLRHFDDKAEECSSSLQAIFQSAAAQTKENLDRRVDDAKAASTRTRAEAKAAAKRLEEKGAFIQASIASLDALSLAPTVPRV